MEWNGELECGTATGFRLHPDSSTGTLDDLFADGQTDAVARIFRARVQTLEDHENVFRELGCDSDSVIAHAEQPVLTGLLRLHRNLRRLFPAELDGVPNQILEDLRHLRTIGPDGGEVCMREHGAAFL